MIKLPPKIIYGKHPDKFFLISHNGLYMIVHRDYFKEFRHVICYLDPETTLNIEYLIDISKFLVDKLNDAY